MKKYQTSVLTAFLVKTAILFTLLYLPVSNFVLGLVTGTWTVQLVLSLIYFYKHTTLHYQRLTNRIAQSFNQIN